MKKNIFTILIIIVAIALIGGGIFLFNTQDKQAPNSNKEKTDAEIAGTTINTGDEETNKDNVSNPETSDKIIEPEKIEEKTLRQSRKQDYLGDQTNVEPTLREEYKYKNLVIKDILFQKRGSTYIFEFTASNDSKDEFNTPKVNLTFYTNLGDKMGSQTIDMPYLKSKEKTTLTFKITNSKFFDACDFALEEIK